MNVRTETLWKGGEGAGDNIALKETKSKNARGVGSGVGIVERLTVNDYCGSWTRRTDRPQLRGTLVINILGQL